MTDDDTLYEHAGSIRYDDARRYVESRGWKRSVSRRAEVGVFHLGDLEAVLPMDTSLRDYASAMVRFARTLAEAEHRPPARVIADLGALRVDRHRPARVGNTADASPTLDAVSAMIDGVRRALLAAACSALQPRAFHPRMTLGDAEAFLDQTRFSHTERGSFVMVVDTPTEVDGARDGFGRDASVLFVRSLAHLASSLRSGVPERITDPVDGSPLVSANLCEALLRMAPPSESADLRFEVGWSPLLSPPLDLPKSIVIDRQMYEPLEQLATKLRPAESHASPWQVGYVKELRGAPGLDGRVEGEVVFTLFEDEETTIRAKAILPADLYAHALLAHAGHKLVTITGTLHRVRRGHVLRDVTEVEFA